ncbi:hypothetical protein [Kitasatospora phosalacinea]|uniref:Uncharacterized protein n=1 Tax=Kitasatospora phosalacinea TaxID=2065 RepID=A0ABW6GT64_9ACTN
MRVLGRPAVRPGREDPPVLVDAGDGWFPFLTRMSLAWDGLVLAEFLLGSPHYDACEFPPALHADLPTRWVG